MSIGVHTTSRNETKYLTYFALGWFVVNCLQAAFLNLEGDEAYYWQLSKNLDWSYFDHPPMVTVLIRLGELLGHGPVFTRLGTVLITTCSILIMYKALPDALKNVRWFILICAATLILNVYSFITTPDAPLLFFASLFLLSYKYFLDKNTLSNTLLMAVTITGMFYSKYHGILLVIFVVLSNLRLLLNKHFWLVVLLTTLFFLPHIYWQYTHDWPSLRFHLNERLAKHYRINYTTDYLLGQLLVFGPFISLLFYATCYKIKIQNKLLRAHAFVFAGTLIFFLISSFKNTVEAHWTLIGTPSFIVLFLWLLNNGTPKYQRIFKKLAIANIALILLARILFFIPHSPFLLIKNYYPFFYGKEWAKTVYSKVGDTPILFENSYVLPSLYMYYNEGAQAIGYNTKSYRKTNFNLQDDCIFSGQNLYYYKGGNAEAPSHTYIDTKYAPGTLLPLKHYTCINALKITPSDIPSTLKANSTYAVTLTIENKADHDIQLYNPLQVDYAFFIAKYDYINSTEDYVIPGMTFQANEKKQIHIQLKTPENPGKYKILFSIKNGILPGNFASAFYPVKVE